MTLSLGIAEIADSLEGGIWLSYNPNNLNNTETGPYALPDSSFRFQPTIHGFDGDGAWRYGPKYTNLVDAHHRQYGLDTPGERMPMEWRNGFAGTRSGPGPNNPSNPNAPNSPPNLNAPADPIGPSAPALPAPGASPSALDAMAHARELDRLSTPHYAGPSAAPYSGLGGYGGGNPDGTGYRGGGIKANPRSSGRRRSLSPRRSVKPHRSALASAALG